MKILSTCGAGRGRLEGRARGAVLFEVVLALVLFAAAAAIISGGLNASLNSVERMRLNAHAGNLAVSVLSELQMGVRSLDMAGPESFEAPFEEWTWELAATAQPAEGDEEDPPTLVEVIIRHEDPPVVYRLSQIIQPAPLSEEAGLEALDDTAPAPMTP